MQTNSLPADVINQRAQPSAQTGTIRPAQPPAVTPGRSTDRNSHVPIEITRVADSIAPTYTLALSCSDGAVAHLSDRERLAFYERVIEQSVSLDHQRTDALFEIHEQKLYSVTHASFARYVKERWNMSSSRAYQIIQFVKLRRLSETGGRGEPPPVNERQARRLGAEQTDQNSYQCRVGRTTNYLRNKLRETPPAQREQFMQDLRAFLNALEQAFEELLPPPGTSTGGSQIEPMTPVTADGNALPQNGIEHVSTPEASAPRTAGPLSKPIHAEPAASLMTSLASAIDRPVSAASAQPTNNQDRPSPSGSTGSVLGLTMEEARKLGLVPRKGSG